MVSRLLAPALTAAALTLACGGCGNSGPDIPKFVETEDIAVCDPSAGPFSTAITHPYFPMSVGHQLVLQGTDHHGAAVVLQVTALPDTELVAGVWTRVVEEHETADGVLSEISRNFFVQTGDGTVCYYGEDVDNYEQGNVANHDGAWRAAVDGATPGIFMPPAPAKGMGFRQEVAIGIAEDRVTITATGDTVTVPAGTYTATVRYLETSPLEPGSTSRKVYASGVGPIVDDIVRLTAVTP